MLYFLSQGKLALNPLTVTKTSSVKAMPRAIAPNSVGQIKFMGGVSRTPSPVVGFVFVMDF
ncbi:MAG: hypothetical protein KME49_20835 [Brasilonema octagenarum HA4186-MV1]|nr:hypothetical protein [Brasilonema octagenarum HA4186-MV1]